MRRTHGEYIVAEGQLCIVALNENGILNIVANDEVTTVQKPLNNAKRVTDRDNGSLTNTASTPDHTSKDAKWGDKDKRYRNT